MADQSFSLISLDVRDDVAYLGLANPPVNIMTGAMMDELSAALETIAGDRALKAVAVTAGEMAGMGLVTRVIPAAELDAALEAVLKDIRRASPLVLRLNTRTLKRSRAVDFAAALDAAERVFLEELMTAEEPREGIAAFYEKRRPKWKNA